MNTELQDSLAHLQRSRRGRGARCSARATTSTTGCSPCRRRTSSIDGDAQTARPARSRSTPRPSATSRASSAATAPAARRSASRSPAACSPTRSSRRAPAPSTIDDRSINSNDVSDRHVDAGRQHVHAHRSAPIAPARRSFRRRPAGRRSSRTLHANDGYVLTVTAENYCNGIPLWDGKDESNITTTTMSSADLYAAAIAQFDSALTLIGTSDKTIRNTTLVGKARTLVDRARPARSRTSFAAAAALVGEVPTNFVLNTMFSTSTAGVVNAIYDWMSGDEELRRLRQGRRQWTRLRLVEGSARQGRRHEDSFADRTAATSRRSTSTRRLNAQVAIATGIEARLIEAESQLAAGNTAAFLATLNALRRRRRATAR